MISAIANFLEYDVYDLMLTAVKTNTELRKILTETAGKSLVVIEDVDCSIDLTGKRKEKKKEKDDEERDKMMLPGMEKEEKDENSKVTLSGLLNFIDSLWSSCGGERIVILTTNHLEKLDPALIRRGRMDMHIEMSYCTFEAFKVLAKNYLGVEKHHLFDAIEVLLHEVNMTPADVVEGLMLKKSRNKDAVDSCLENLIRVINVAKEEAKKKAEQEAVKEKNESLAQKELCLEDGNISK